MTCRHVVTIAKEQIAPMPVVSYTGNIAIVETEEQAAAALEEIFKCEIVGFDTETKPTFRKGHPNNVALMQVSDGARCWLFRVNKLGVEGSVKRFLESTQVKKVGLSLKDDFFVMHRSCEFEPAGFIDLQGFVKEFGIADASLQKIFAILFGQRISKGQRLSNWEAAELTAAQQMYASIDAWACLRIYNYLQSGKFVAENSPYYTTVEIGEQ